MPNLKRTKRANITFTIRFEKRMTYADVIIETPPDTHADSKYIPADKAVAIKNIIDKIFGLKTTLKAGNATTQTTPI